MKAILISDLHLDEERPDITQAFKKFLNEQVLDKELDSFYILGDLFELWIGDDYQHPYLLEIKTLLKKASDQIEHCYFQHGNRDFLVGELFEQETGFQVLDETHCFELPQGKVMLMHGDSLCTLDTEYMQARTFLRSEPFIKEMMAKSVEERLQIAAQLRGASKDANSNKNMDIMDVTPEEVVNLMEAEQIDFLIHGHTHRPNTHKLDLAHNSQAERIVMSDWEGLIRYTEISESGPELKSFQP